MCSLELMGIFLPAHTITIRNQVISFDTNENFHFAIGKVVFPFFWARGIWMLAFSINPVSFLNFDGCFRRKFVCGSGERSPPIPLWKSATIRTRFDALCISFTVQAILNALKQVKQLKISFLTDQSNTHCTTKMYGRLTVSLMGVMYDNKLSKL